MIARMPHLRRVERTADYRPDPIILTTFMPEHDLLAPLEPASAPSVTPAVPIRVPPIAVPAEPVRLLNREFSWIGFNRRVLAEAFDETVPLLERLKFLSIASTNLDEFMMVRVGTIGELIAIQERSADGLTPKQQLKGIRERVKELLSEMYRCLESVVAALDK